MKIIFILHNNCTFILQNNLTKWCHCLALALHIIVNNNIRTFYGNNSHHKKSLLSSWQSHLSSGRENCQHSKQSTRGIQECGLLPPPKDKVTVKSFLKFYPESESKTNSYTIRSTNAYFPKALHQECPQNKEEIQLCPVL